LKPSDELTAALTGQLPVSELSDGVLNRLKLPVYFIACSLLLMTRNDMIKAAEELPDDIKQLAREECRRLLEIRRRNGDI
jgi:hypothetical protein